MKKLFVGLVGTGFLLAAAAPQSFAGDMPRGLEGYRFAGESESCVSSSRIKRTTAIDDEHILFEMNGKKTYLNTLNGRCPGLKMQDSFAYKTTGSRLCSGTIITVLHSGDAGSSCSLGRFDLLERVENE